MALRIANCESCIHCRGGWDVEYGYDCKLKYVTNVPKIKGEHYCHKYATIQDAFEGNFSIDNDYEGEF